MAGTPVPVGRQSAGLQSRLYSIPRILKQLNAVARGEWNAGRVTEESPRGESPNLAFLANINRRLMS